MMNECRSTGAGVWWVFVGLVGCGGSLEGFSADLERKRCDAQEVCADNASTDPGVAPLVNNLQQDCMDGAAGEDQRPVFDEACELDKDARDACLNTEWTCLNGLAVEPPACTSVCVFADTNTDDAPPATTPVSDSSGPL